MSDVKLSNIPSMPVGKLVAELSAAYGKIIRAGLPVRVMPSVMLWGPPGVGKSQAVRQIAGHINRAAGKPVHVIDVRLLLFNPIDLRGIPTANADRTLAVWLRPQIFQMDAGDDVMNILFLDEISAAPQSVQAAAYQIVLDRTVGSTGCRRTASSSPPGTAPRINPSPSRCRRPWQTGCSISRWKETLPPGGSGRFGRG